MKKLEKEGDGTVKVKQDNRVICKYLNGKKEEMQTKKGNTKRGEEGELAKEKGRKIIRTTDETRNGKRTARRKRKQKQKRITMKKKMKNKNKDR